MEMYRLCKKKEGILQVVIPCEGGLAYSFARKISTKRIFEKRYGQSFKWFIEREHLSPLLRRLLISVLTLNMFPLIVTLYIRNSPRNSFQKKYH